MTNSDTSQPEATIGERLSGASTGTIVLLLERLGFRGCYMTGVGPVTPSTCFAGPARTVRCLPTRPDVVEQQRQSGSPSMHKQAIDGISQGDVLVIDTRGTRDAAVMGDLFAERMKVAGAVGVVADGCIRDAAEISKVGIPVYASGLHNATLGNRLVTMDIGMPIACGGVLVMPGDYLVGDSMGVVVIPKQLVGKVLDAMPAQEELDTFIREKIQEGLTLARAYPPDEVLQMEYRAWVERRRAESR